MAKVRTKKQIKRSELEKLYPQANIDYLIAMLEHEIYLATYEKAKKKEIDDLFTSDNGFIAQFRNQFQKVFGNIETFGSKTSSKRNQFYNMLEKFMTKLQNELIEFSYENIASIYNYNRLYYLWMLDESIPEYDIYKKPDVLDFASEQEVLVGEAKRSKKIYDPDFTEKRLRQLINQPRYKKTTAERTAEAVSKTDIALKQVFNDAVTPLSNSPGKTYLTVLKEMEGQINSNVKELQKRCVEFDIQGVSEEAENDVFNANSHIIPNKFQRVEILDKHTCLYCASIDKKVSEKRYGRIHPNCRGKDVPVKVEGGEIVYRQGIKGRRRRDDSFQRWFDKLSKNDKMRVLGKKKYELYEAGNFDLKELIKGNRVLTLSELEKSEAIKKLKDSLTDLDKSRALISKMKDELPKKSVGKIVSQSEITAYNKFLNSKLEVYKAIPNEVLRKNGTDRRTLIAEVKRERKVLDAKRKELNLKKALAEFNEANSNL